jgi:hypothetical protein
MIAKYQTNGSFEKLENILQFNIKLRITRCRPEILRRSLSHISVFLR